MNKVEVLTLPQWNSKLRGNYTVRPGAIPVSGTTSEPRYAKYTRDQLVEPPKLTATYAKLKGGEWGICVALNGRTWLPVVGEEVTVSKKTGEKKTEVVADVVWSDANTALCAIHRERKRKDREDDMVIDMEDGILKPYHECDMPPY